MRANSHCHARHPEISKRKPHGHAVDMLWTCCKCCEFMIVYVTFLVFRIWILTWSEASWPTWIVCRYFRVSDVGCWYLDFPNRMFQWIVVFSRQKHDGVTPVRWCNIRVEIWIGGVGWAADGVPFAARCQRPQRQLSQRCSIVFSLSNMYIYIYISLTICIEV